MIILIIYLITIICYWKAKQTNHKEGGYYEGQEVGLIETIIMFIPFVNIFGLLMEISSIKFKWFNYKKFFNIKDKDGS